MLPSAIGLPNLRSASINPPRTNLDLNIANIARWLQGCENSHTQCSERNDYLAMRLMDLEIDDSSIKLIETETPPIPVGTTTTGMHVLAIARKNPARNI